MVFYRKYRPQTIAELDSSKVREILYAVLKQPEIPHAFLLTGPKGLGKTSTARIIAKVVNCEHLDRSSVSSRQPSAKDQRPKTSDQIEPDNICEQCVSITNGSNLDVLEIDGASNRGIDEIRDVRDKVKLAPSSAKKKIYIIDEVHMLTTEAFNALLKTIEEPPSHVMFIFCTTEPQKVPETIISRCFHLAYHKATTEDIVHSLERVVQGEKLQVDKEALEEIAALADGGFRDATKILEELVMLSNGGNITKELLEKQYSVTSVSHFVSRMLALLAERNTKEGLALVVSLQEQGVDSKYFTSQILESLHVLLLESVGISPIRHQPFAIRTEDIQQLVSLFSDAYQQTKYAVIPQLPLELAVVEWCSAKDPVILRNEVTPESDPGQVRKTSSHPMDALLKKEKNLQVQSILKGPKEPKVPEGPKVQSAQEELTDKSVSEQFMENLIYKIKPINFSIAGVLRGCKVKKLTDSEVVLQTAYKFHKEKLNETKVREIIEKAIKEITGKPLQVMVELT